MYSTCIGLILRGYHDYESGRMRFSGEGGNYIHMTANEPMQVSIPTVTPAAGEEAPVTSPEQQAEAYRQKARRRNDNVKRLFDGLKGKFMKMFEDVEDEEIG